MSYFFFDLEFRDYLFIPPHFTFTREVTKDGSFRLEPDYYLTGTSRLPGFFFFFNFISVRLDSNFSHLTRS